MEWKQIVCPLPSWTAAVLQKKIDASTVAMMRILRIRRNQNLKMSSSQLALADFPFSFPLALFFFRRVQ